MRILSLLASSFALAGGCGGVIEAEPDAGCGEVDAGPPPECGPVCDMAETCVRELDRTICCDDCACFGEVYRREVANAYAACLEEPKCIADATCRENALDGVAASAAGAEFEAACEKRRDGECPELDCSASRTYIDAMLENFTDCMNPDIGITCANVQTCMDNLLGVRCDPADC